MDVIALGELLIDFTPCQPREGGRPRYEMNPGGAPANVLAALAKWGKKTGFIGKVGDDEFGHHLQKVLKQNGIDDGGLLFSRDFRTTLAIVRLNENGERSFWFYRNPGADQMLTEDEIPCEWIQQTKIFHFGSVSLTDEPSRTATFKALECAQKHGVLVSFDPNYRAPLWKREDEAFRTIHKVLNGVHLLKLSEEELRWIAQTDDLLEGTRKLYKEYGINLIFVTMGEKGSLCRKGDWIVYSPGRKVKVVDTTGAGDAYWAAVLYQVLARLEGIQAITEETLKDIQDFANQAAAIVTTRRGALPAMPALEEVESDDFGKFQ